MGRVGIWTDQLPRGLRVNWFRKADDGHFLWLGTGQNARVLEWITRRCEGEVVAVASPIYHLADDDVSLCDGRTARSAKRFIHMTWDYDSSGHQRHRYRPTR